MPESELQAGSEVQAGARAGPAALAGRSGSALGAALGAGPAAAPAAALAGPVELASAPLPLPTIKTSTPLISNDMSVSPTSLNLLELL